MHTSRRDFLRMGTLGATGLLLPAINGNAYPQPPVKDELASLSTKLLFEWGETLLSLQVNQPAAKGVHGGILCPACATIHGRCSDMIYPFLYLAQQTKQQRYMDAALRLYDWAEEMVSTEDGAWLNEVSTSDWKGITVFGATALAESLIHFGHLLPKATREKWKIRLQRATEYVYQNFTITYGNINYPVAGSYLLALTGQYLQEPRYAKRGKELAHESLAYITTSNLLYGEGRPKPDKSPKGCYAVDLGYNVEESLPSLVQYALLTNDTEITVAVMRSMKAHLEFMLPDGTWDNSWGTRNYKWTWWGSRTSDGCLPAYGLLTDKDPVFYTAALQNTRLLAACTHNKLLHGGPHYVSHGIKPCVAHAMAHSKAMVTYLLHAKPAPSIPATLPRTAEYGLKAFPEIYTWLISKNKWRGTVTAYDQEYTMKGGHATGGALSLLWHNDAGPLLSASMNQYQMVESFNMQKDRDPHSIPLTAGFRLQTAEKLFLSTQDLKATIQTDTTPSAIRISTQTSLVDAAQTAAPDAACQITYTFAADSVTIKAVSSNPAAVFSLPVISARNETVSQPSPTQIIIRKPGALVEIESSVAVKVSVPLNERIFNFVPGMEAVPIILESNQVEISISVKKLS
ncbi:hypothetical protein SAMN05444266_108162 [Chitinophaga jiangningensis]|uniref:Uncharacterized protein n=1 Tax=Chitinophaga jiangningensis TaxID=1419482 RepID=A0A1M7IZV6_9BACT|nr:hypothetical protein [Chitinophaga jiangningensis]SHM46235.1 hypothetical protein SAMN05444266_108162 [Chitinophaga jiangningensis]